MDVDKTSDDELLGLNHSTSDSDVINISGEGNDSTATAKPEDIEDELLLLSSPSPPRESVSVTTAAADNNKAGHSNNNGKGLLPTVEVVTLDDELEILDDSTSEGEKGIISDESSEAVEDSMLEGKINIFFSNGALFVWNADDVQMLREECRIVGKLTGCLPRAPRQNNHLGLPLQLMPEEAKLLVDIDAAIIVEEDAASEKARIARESAFKTVREENYKIQQRLYKENRKEEVRHRMGQIIAGKKAKKRKLQEEKQDLEDSGNKKKTDVEEDKDEQRDSTVEKSGAEKVDVENSVGDEKVDKEEIDGETQPDEEMKDQEDKEEEDKLTVEDIVTSETSIKHSLVQIFTENPWKGSVKQYTSWEFPHTEREAIRYIVFKDLWKKGYYLTSGAKFGGDFLVYPGDPCRFHSHFIAVCADQSHEMSVLDIVSMGRLASNVRKTTILCTLNRRRKVTYTSLQWTGIS